MIMMMGDDDDVTKSRRARVYKELAKTAMVVMKPRRP